MYDKSVWVNGDGGGGGGVIKANKMRGDKESFSFFARKPSTHISVIFKTLGGLRGDRTATFFGTLKQPDFTPLHSKISRKVTVESRVSEGRVASWRIRHGNQKEKLFSLL